MELDPVILSRIQFGFVISFHIIFPAFTIGLAAWLAQIEDVNSKSLLCPSARATSPAWLSSSAPFRSTGALRRAECFLGTLTMKKKIFVAVLFVVALPVWLLLPDVAFSQSASFLDPGGEIAAGQKSHLIRITALTMVAIIPVFLLLPLILIKYRRSGKGRDYKPTWDFYLPLEIMIWGVPVAIVGFMSWHLWKSTHDLDPYKSIESASPTINVQVVGLDWKWLFIYPDLGIATVGEIGIPVKHPVAMTLTTDTVMQSFIISALVGQINAMAGMTTKLNFVADHAGTFEGENMLYNGIGFVDQKFDAIAMDSEAFETWVRKVKAEGVVLDQNAYNTLAVQGSAAAAHASLGSNTDSDRTIYFTLPDAQLFHNIVVKYHNGAPLPLDQQPGTSAFNAAVKGEASQ